MAEVLPAVVEAQPVALPRHDGSVLAQREPAVPAVQAAAVVAGGFVAGAATIALARRVATRPARRRRRRLERFDVVSTRSFLVDVHLLDRR
ncbi:MAG: hypothetical protein DLM63_05680 [Solirubrobacterales bacterium]|nr:MAG: hypothetical protein DLM63_05680 [Solirubrobacterales bacterium]